MTADNFCGYRHVLKYKQLLSGERLAELGMDPIDPEKQKLANLLQSMPEKTVEVRVDPLFGKHSLHTSFLSEERTKRPLVNKPVDNRNIEASSCDFCRPDVYKKTAVPKIIHSYSNIITVPNLFPFSVPHYVTLFTNNHVTSLSELTDDDMASYLLSAVELAKIIQDQGCDGMWEMLNWGFNAGGSQPHPHAQRGGLYEFMNTLADKECEALEKHKIDLNGADPFESFMDLFRDSQLFIYEDEEVFVCAPFAPRFADQVDIYTKKKDTIISSYLGLKEQNIKSISRIMNRILKDLSIKRGVADLNIVTHQARFNADNCYRLHWHIYPRAYPVSGMEINDCPVIVVFPEDTAEALR